VSKHHSAVGRRSARASVLAGLAFLPLLATASDAAAAPSSDTTRTVTLTEPAVAYVATAFTVSVRVAYPDPDQVTGKGFAEFEYSTPYGTGSAFGVSAGNFVTAAHVVQVPAEAAHNYAANKVFFTELDFGYRLERGQSPFERYEISDNEVLDGWLQQCYRGVAGACDFDYRVAVTVQLPGQEAGTASKPMRATVLSDTERAAENDVSVLRVGSGGVLNPTAPLATSSAGLEDGEPVVAVAFPGQAAALPTGTTQPAKAFGRISNIRDYEAGQVVEVDIRLQDGMSGGAAVNAKGEVIGLISFTTVDGKGNRGQGYLRTVEDIRSALRDVGIEATRGEVDTLFADAMELYWDGHYSAALPYFQKVLNLYGRHALARKYLADAQSKASGQDDIPLTAPSVEAESSSLPLIGGAAAAVILVALVGWALLRRRRKARAPVDTPLDPAASAAGQDGVEWRPYDDTTTPDAGPEVSSGAPLEEHLLIHQPITPHEHPVPAPDGVHPADLDHQATGRKQESFSTVPAPALTAIQRFCQHCGAPVRPHGRFCPQCGQRQ
jgi:S1-C subfamily serine protease